MIGDQACELIQAILIVALHRLGDQGMQHGLVPLELCSVRHLLNKRVAERIRAAVYGRLELKKTCSAEAAKGGIDYRMISYPGAEHPSGGVFGSAGRFPGHATFNVTVADVEEACRRVESLGGKVARKVVGNQNGSDFAYVLDPAGNLFGVFTT